MGVTSFAPVRYAIELFGLALSVGGVVWCQHSLRTQLNHLYFDFKTYCCHLHFGKLPVADSTTGGQHQASGHIDDQSALQVWNRLVPPVWSFHNHRTHPLGLWVPLNA